MEDREIMPMNDSLEISEIQEISFEELEDRLELAEADCTINICIC